MNRIRFVCAVASALGMMTAVSTVQASGFALHEQGASGLGNAYAGAAAVAEDATTVWWNPAGMARLGSGKHFSIAGALIAPSTKFSNGASVPATLSNPAFTGTGGDAGSSALVPSLFFAMDIAPRWNVGLAVGVPFGLKTTYDSNWIGRFQGIKSEVKTLNINPAVSYKISGAASIGFGISYQRGKVDLLSATNYSAIAFGAGGAGLLGAVGGPGVEGQNTTSVDGDALGFNAGGLFDVGPATRIGVHYRSSLQYKLDGTTSFSGVPAPLAVSPLLSDGTVRLNLTTPSSYAFSILHKLNNRWDLLGDFMVTQWSNITQLPLVRTSGAASGATLDTLTFNFRDTYRASIGANYKLDGAWTLKMGAAYDQTPVPDARSRSVRLPDGDRLWLSAGAKYQVSRNGVLDIGYSYLKVRNTDINNDQRATGRGLVNGTYKANINIFGLQYQHSF